MRLLVTVYTCIIVAQCTAQADSTKLFYADRIESDAFVHIGGSLYQMGEKTALTTEFALNWLVNHSYYLGAHYVQLSTQENIDGIILSETGKSISGPVYVHYQRAGIQAGYIAFHDKLFSLSPEIQISWAAIRYEYPVSDIYRWNFAQINPAVHTVLNASDYFRIGVSLSYIRAIGLDLNGINNNHFSGIGAGVFIRVGTF